MRFDDEHAYDKRIYDLELIKEHFVPEQRFRKFIFSIAKKHGGITGMYWLTDIVCALNPREFPEERKIALKKLMLKVYTCYSDNVTTKQMVGVLKECGYGKTEIADILHISRNSVYYFINREVELPTQCMLTYGEYNLMMDFMDCWEELYTLSCFNSKGEKVQ